MNKKSYLPDEINKLIIDNLTDVVFYLAVEDQQFRFTSVNKSFLKVTGLIEQQVVGQLASDVIPENSYNIVEKHYRAAVKDKKTVQWHEISEYPSGKKYGNVTIVPLMNSENNCFALLGTVHDVTEITEAGLSMNNMMDRISDGLVSMDAKMNYTFVNKKAGQLLGKNPEDLIGKNYWTEYPEARGSIFANSYVESFKQQRFIEINDFYPGLERWFENRIYPSPNGITIFFSDVTEKIEDEIELMEAKSIAETASAAKTNFLEIAAHELRNPATTIYLMVHALMIQFANGEKVDSDKISKLLVPIERLNHLLVDLLDLSRLQKNIVRLQKSPSDLKKLIQDWIGEFKFKAHNRIINFHSPESISEVILDPIRIYQVFINLLENAFKYSPVTSPIDIYIEEKGEVIRVTIKDYGMGISAEALEHIFDPFNLGGHDIKIRHDGLGLGLSICKNIMRLHDGEIEVTSTVGVGSSFYFELKKGK